MSVCFLSKSTSDALTRVISKYLLQRATPAEHDHAQAISNSSCAAEAHSDTGCLQTGSYDGKDRAHCARSSCSAASTPRWLTLHLSAACESPAAAIAEAATSQRSSGVSSEPFCTFACCQACRQHLITSQEGGPYFSSVNQHKAGNRKFTVLSSQPIRFLCTLTFVECLSVGATWGAVTLLLHPWQ